MDMPHDPDAGGRAARRETKNYIYTCYANVDSDTPVFHYSFPSFASPNVKHSRPKGKRRKQKKNKSLERGLAVMCSGQGTPLD
jgi:hypothetical protein